MWQDTTSFEKIEALTQRLRIVQGGTSAAKTISILMKLIDDSFESRGEIISVCTDTFPNLRRGAMRDFKNILAGTARDYYFVENKTSHFFTNKSTDSVIEFFSTDEAGALGARRNKLFINEANRINYETFSQLEVRTKDYVYADFNPVNKFWVHNELIGKRPDLEFLKLTYKDNEALDPAIINAIEMRKGDGTSNWWRVYGLGEIGSLEGNVYSGWKPIDNIPATARLVRYGVDFGFSNDPTAIVGIYEGENGELYLKELFYKTSVLTPALIEFCKTLPDALFVCDNARPEIIAEMAAAGLRTIPCDKGKGSVIGGIDKVSQREIYYTTDSKNLEQEFLTYAWRRKRGSGEQLDEPQDGNDHLMDALRYAVWDLSRKVIEWGGVR